LISFRQGNGRLEAVKFEGGRQLSLLSGRSRHKGEKKVRTRKHYLPQKKEKGGGPKRTESSQIGKKRVFLM